MRTVRHLVSSLAFLALLCGLASPVHAALQIDSTLGGTALAGAYYVNFDELTLGQATPRSPQVRNQSGTVVGNISLVMRPDAQVVQGASSGRYAPPYLSGSNGMFFGNPSVPGPDTTPYITSGRDFSPNTGASATLDLSAYGSQDYFGILWGSIDTYNTLQFFDGNTLVGTITGSNVLASPTGNQGVQGTRYINIFGTNGTVFTKVVATSSQYAFEFDNVAFDAVFQPGTAVPEPGTLLAGLSAAALGALAAARRRLRATA